MPTEGRPLLSPVPECSVRWLKDTSFRIATTPAAMATRNVQGGQMSRPSAVRPKVGARSLSVVNNGRSVPAQKLRKRLVCASCHGFVCAGRSRKSRRVAARDTRASVRGFAKRACLGYSARSAARKYTAAVRAIAAATATATASTKGARRGRTSRECDYARNVPTAVGTRARTVTDPATGARTVTGTGTKSSITGTRTGTGTTHRERRTTAVQSRPSHRVASPRNFEYEPARNCQRSDSEDSRTDGVPLSLVCHDIAAARLPGEQPAIARCWLRRETAAK